MFPAPSRVRLLIGSAFLLAILLSSTLAVGGLHPTTAPSAPTGTMPLVPAPSSSAPMGTAAFPHRAVAPATPSPGSGTYVNPFALISSEPAPMGMADFGVSGTTGNVHAYSYSSPIWEGTVQIDNMLTSGGSSYMTFQLNLLLVFTLGGNNYTYWVQNIASIDSSNGGIGWIDNIWNFSAPSNATYPNGDPLVGQISGNGSVADDPPYLWYADSQSSGYAGSGILLSYPTSLTIRTVDSVVSGIPHVGFEYNDGFGWVTWDNVTFHNMAHATNVGFLVDGYEMAPIGIFYDAEWDYSGSGYGQHNVHSSLNMSLQYWNGHNYQSPVSAYNFGSDTAESLNNVISSLGSVPSNGSLFSHEANGSGSLGLLYNSSTISTLDVSSPNASVGAIAINGSQNPFRGGAASFTLAPGEYDVALWVGGQLKGSENVTLLPGGTVHIILPPPSYSVQFEESGLPAGTAWSVAVDGTSVMSVQRFDNFSLSNGTYSWALTPVPGFVPDAYSGPLPVRGLAAVISIQFEPYTFMVTFAEFNLPTGTTWSVSTPAGTNSTTGAQIVIVEANGTFAYNVSSLYAYQATPATGNLSIVGRDVYQEIDFSVRPGTIAGSVFPTNATVLVDGTPVTVTGGAFLLDSELPAFYTVEASVSGYVSQWHNVTVTAGNTSRADFTLSPTGPSTIVPHTNPNTSSGSAGFTTTDLVVVVVAILAIGIIGAVVLLRRPPARRP